MNESHFFSFARITATVEEKKTEFNKIRNRWFGRIIVARDCTVLELTSANILRLAELVLTLHCCAVLLLKEAGRSLLPRV